MNELINMIKYQPILVYYSRIIYLWNSVYLLASFHCKPMKECEKNNKTIQRTFSKIINLTNSSIHFIFIIVSNVNRTISSASDRLLK